MLTRNSWVAILIALTLVPATLLLWIQPLFFGKLIPQVDRITHLRWSYQFQKALTEGWLVPRWAFASHQGLGDPTFLYYSPLLYYLTSLFRALGFSPERALLAASWFPYLLLGIVSAICFRHVARTWIGITAGMLVLSCPALFFLSTHYGALPWVLAAPFVLSFAIVSVKDDPNPLIVSVTYALICLSHILSSFMILLMVGGARLTLGRAALLGQIRWGAGVLLGFGLAAFYLYPALTLQGLINPAGWTNDPTLDWRRAFAFPVASYYQFGTRWFAIQWPLPLLALSMIVSIFLLTKGKDWSDDSADILLAKRLGLVALIGLLLSSELAYALYEHIESFQKLQWPYRFTVPSLLIVTFALGLLLERVRDSKFRWLVIGVILTQVLMAAHLQYSIALHGRVVPKLEASLNGEFGQPEYLPATRGGGWQRYLIEGGFKGECNQKHWSCETLETYTHLRQWRVTVPDGAVIKLPVFAFKGWGAEIDGQKVSTAVDAETGLLTVVLPQGMHKVSVRWLPLQEELFGRYISVACLLGFLFISATVIVKNFQMQR